MRVCIWFSRACLSSYNLIHLCESRVEQRISTAVSRSSIASSGSAESTKTTSSSNVVLSFYIQWLRMPPPMRCATRNTSIKTMARIPIMDTKRGVLEIDPRAASSSDSGREARSTGKTSCCSCCLGSPYRVLPHGLYTESIVFTSKTSKPPPEFGTQVQPRGLGGNTRKYNNHSHPHVPPWLNPSLCLFFRFS